MTFTSIEFIFIFFPLSLIGYYLIDKKLKNIFLFVISLLFYSVGEPVMVGLLFCSVCVNYLMGFLLSKEWKFFCVKKILLLLMLIWNFGLLFYYKYLSFSINIFNSMLGKDFVVLEIIQPLGISFFTFRMVSYCLDVYWKIVPVQNNFIDVALYMIFFPQVTMGPISKYNDFSKQLVDRKFDLELFLQGIKRFIIGLFKKLVIADSIAPLVDTVFNGGKERTVFLAWMGIWGYLLQLYYDFSGYSDMAIGLGQLFGFKTPENFKYPYVSKSIVEYWTRWHATLGIWLKNYIYTPVFRALQNRNIAINKCDILALLGVWLFAGIWHGAGFNYLFYGLYYFSFIVLERVVDNYKKKRRKRLKLKKQPETLSQKVVSHIYFFVVLIFGQLMFRSNTLENFIMHIKSMFGMFGNSFIDVKSIFYWEQNAVLFIVGTIFCFPVIDFIKGKIKGNIVEKLFNIVTPVVYAVLLIVAFAFAVTNTYQAFIYFEF